MFPSMFLSSLLGLLACAPSDVSIRDDIAPCPSLDPEEISLTQSQRLILTQLQLWVTGDAVITSAAWIPSPGGGDAGDVLVPHISHLEVSEGDWIDVDIPPIDGPTSGGPTSDATLSGHVYLTTLSDCDLTTFIITEAP